MDQEQSWIQTQTVGEDVNTAAENYNYFMRPEPRDNLGPIETIDDPYLGRTKVRKLRIGMVRNAKDEDKKEVTAYLEPYPHTRIDDAKPLQGWYKSLHEPKGTRPRPCFTEAILTEPYGGWCLPGDALVETPFGPTLIRRLKPGDLVISESGGRPSVSEVLATIDRWCETGLVVIQTESGDSVRLTAEHPVYSKSRGDYIPAGELYVGEKIETRSVQELRKISTSIEGQRTSGILRSVSIPSVANVGSREGCSGPSTGSVGVLLPELRRGLRVDTLDVVFGLYDGSPTQSGEDEKRKTDRYEGCPASTGSSRETVRCSNREEAFRGDEGEVRGERPVGNYGAQALQEEPVRLPTGQSVQPPIVVGEGAGRTSRRDGGGLGVRTGGDSTRERGRLLAGLPTGERRDIGSQGVYGREGSVQDSSSATGRISSNGVRREETQEAGTATVKAVVSDSRPLRVYDIQTTAGNFYVRGTLDNTVYHLHNCAVGCAFSLPAGEMVDTPDGSRPIESFNVGDEVYGRDWGGTVVTRVLGTSAHVSAKGIIVITVSDGRRLRMTGDHPVYSAIRGWVNAETLYPGEPLENLQVYGMRRIDSQQGLLSTVLVGDESAEENAAEGVPRLRGRTSNPIEDDVRRLYSENSRGERSENGRQTVRAQGSTEVGGDESENVGCGTRTSREYVGAGARPEIGAVPIGPRGGCSQRRVGIQTVQAQSLYGSEGADIQYEVGVGATGSRAPRCERNRLGLRTGFDSTPQRSGLRPRLSTQSVGGVRRDQRVYDARGSREDRRGEITRIFGDDSRPIRIEAYGSPYVVRVERIPGAVRVYDIETETENFYQRGVLVHNCYVNSGFRGYRGTGLITVPLDYGEQIAKQLTKVRRAAAGYFSSFTDPFTPLEAYYHNTENAAREFVKVGLPIFFLSRLRYPTWAIDLLKMNPHSYAQKSINTSNPEDWRRLSPGAMSYRAHLADIARIRKAGIYVSIQCNPIVPGVTSHDDVFRLFRDLATAGANHVIVKFVEAGYSWAPAMTERMIKRFGARGEAFAKLFTENIGGQRTIEESYRMDAHRRYSDYAKEFGLTYATCYEYRYERDANGRIIDKTGVSVGREFTTADQCHGHAVPVYRRDSDHELFQPVEDCPPSGCLYCASENGGEARCGDSLAGEANAVRSADLKIPIGQGVARNENNPTLIQLGRIKR